MSSKLKVLKPGAKAYQDALELAKQLSDKNPLRQLLILFIQRSSGIGKWEKSDSKARTAAIILKADSAYRDEIKTLFGESYQDLEEEFLDAIKDLDVDEFWTSYQKSWENYIAKKFSKTILKEESLITQDKKGPNYILWGSVGLISIYAIYKFTHKSYSLADMDDTEGG